MALKGNRKEKTASCAFLLVGYYGNLDPLGLILYGRLCVHGRDVAAVLGWDSMIAVLTGNRSSGGWSLQEGLDG